MTFTPTNLLGDYTSTNERQRALDDRSMQPFYASQSANNQYLNRQAESAGANLQILLRASKIAEKYFVDKQKKKNADDEAAGKAAYLWEDLTPDQDETYNQVYQELKDSGLSDAQASSEALKSGVRYDVAEMLKSQSAWFKVGYARAHLNQHSDNAGNWLTTQMASNETDLGGFSPKTAVGAQQRAAALSFLAKEYLKVDGVHGYNVQFLQKELYPGLRKAINDYQTKANKQDAVDNSAIERDRASMVFQATLTEPDSVNLYLASVSGTVDDKNNPLGMAGAQTEFRNLIDEMIEAGTMTPDKLEAILSQKPTHLGGATYAEGYKTWAKGIRNKLQDETTTRLKKKLEAQKNRGRQFEITFNDETQERYEQGKPWSNEELAAKTKEYEGLTGLEEPEFIKNIQTRQESDDDDARSVLDKLRKSRGYLIKDDLDLYSPQIYKEYLPLVNADRKLAEIDESKLKNYQSTVEGFANKAMQLGGDDSRDPKYAAMKRNGYARFKQKVQQYVRTGNPLEGKNGALQMALEDVEKEFDLNSDKAGFAFLDKPTDRTANDQVQLDLNDTIDYLNSTDSKVLKQLPEGLNRQLPSVINYRDSEDPKRTIPSFFVSATRDLRHMDPVQLMNLVLEANGEPNLFDKNKSLENVIKGKDYYLNQLGGDPGDFNRPSQETNAQTILKIDALTNEEIYNSGAYVIPSLVGGEP